MYVGRSSSTGCCDGNSGKFNSAAQVPPLPSKTCYATALNPVPRAL